MRTFAILGPGGVGGFLAAALDRAGGAVTVVAREPAAEAIARDGIRVRSVRLGDFESHPAAVGSLDGPVDALLVATKAVGLEGALARVSGLEPRIVLPLLNGLDHLDLLREHFGERAVAGSIRIESTRVATGEIEQTSGFLRIDMASADPAMRGPLEQLARALDRAAVPARVMDSEAQAMWGKLVRLNALACTTSAWDLPLGAIRSDPERRAALEACVREAAAVAEAEGARVSPDATMAELDDAHAELRTSMQRDIAAGREPELDAIPGSVLRAAARHGLECPTIESLAALAAGRAARRADVRAPMG
jgi:2-dehydropantoate 2-reductase